METNRAKAVAMKAEVRRTKARLMDEIKKLHKLAQKKVKICLNFGYFGVLMYVCIGEVVLLCVFENSVFCSLFWLPIRRLVPVFGPI